jgi:hypothetical protein
MPRPKPIRQLRTREPRGSLPSPDLSREPAQPTIDLNARRFIRWRYGPILRLTPVPGNCAALGRGKLRAQTRGLLTRICRCAQSCQIRDSYEVNQVTAKIRFERQYRPVQFGDPPDPRTVDDKRRSAIQAAETRRLNRMRGDYEETEDHRRRWLVRLSDFFGWGLTHSASDKALLCAMKISMSTFAKCLIHSCRSQSILVGFGSGCSVASPGLLLWQDIHLLS